MSKWKMVKLGDVCNNNIQTISSNDDYQIDYIDISSVDNQTKKIVSYNTFTFKEAPSRARQILQENDILVSTVRPNLNAVAINSLKSENIVVGSTGYCVLRCNDKIERDYLFYFCQSETFILALVKKAKGASYPAVSNSDVKSCLIPLPPLDEQKRIADVLDKASELIKKRKEQIRLMDELSKSLFIEMFGDPVENPMGWDVESLSNICNKITDGTHNSPENFEKGDYKYITAKNIKENGFDFKTLTYVTRDDHREIFSRCNPEYGDILYIKDGVTTGIAQINTLDEEFSLLSSVALLKPNPQKVINYYLRDVLNNRQMYLQIRDNMDGAAITRLTINKITSLKIPLPPLALQQEFADRITVIEQQKALLQNGLAKMETAYKALMQEYFG